MKVYAVRWRQVGISDGLEIHSNQQSASVSFDTCKSYADYCEIQHLLSFENATFYNSGVYGWNWDGYIIDSERLIITGYRNLTGKDCPYTLANSYDKEAAKKDTKQERRELLIELLNEIDNL